MTEDRFGAFLASRIESFATDMVTGRGWASDGAREKSSDWHSRILRRGLATPDQYFFVVQLDDTRVGDLWLAVEGPPDSAGGYILHFSIDEPFRRRGIGSAAMARLEDEAAHLGLLRLAIHVFTYNTVAIQFFRTVGFRDVTLKGTRLKMTKSLSWIR